MDVKIHDSWKKVLRAEFEKPYFADIKSKLIEEKNKYTIYPSAKLIFNAFDITPFDNVKVVILGQDPYHGPGQAMGLSFSVPQGVVFPPSLRNMYKELQDDIGILPSTNGDLTKRAEQGVLLLNAFLTVRSSEAASHQKLGRESFTDAVIKTISDEKEHIVFILWGNFARSKKHLIDTSKHLVIESAHPSPLSAHNGFFGSKPYSKVNEYLREHGLKEIDRKI